MTDPNLVTTCNFKGREYLIKMNVTNNTSVELLITDKYTGEDWQCCYDVAYIENLTHRTGNFKQFNIFVTMLKSGLLKTSECVSLDLLTYDDLEILRTRRGKAFYPNTNNLGNLNPVTSNRRYLILTYSVEFDRIHYPLPLEYCGPPDPQVLQGNIRRLENEVARLQDYIAKQNNSSNIKELQFKIEDLTQENRSLREEIKHLNRLLDRKPNTQLNFLQNAIKNLEDGVVSERSSHNRLVRRLQEEKYAMQQELEQLRERVKHVSRGISPVGKKSNKRISDPGINLRTISPRKAKSQHRPTSPGYLGDGLPIDLTKLRPKSSQLNRIDIWENTLQHRDKTPEKLKRRQQSITRQVYHESYIQSENEILSSRPSSRRENLTKQRSHVRSRSGSNCSCHSRNSSASSPRRMNLGNSRTSIHSKTKPLTPKKVLSKSSEIDYGNLENRIHAIQKMLSEGLNLE